MPSPSVVSNVAPRATGFLVASGLLLALAAPSAVHAQRCPSGVAARWEAYRGMHEPQPISPTEDGSVDTATLFREATRRVRTMMRLFRPNPWGMGSIALDVDPTSPEERPRVRVDVRLRLGPVSIAESVPSEVAHCPVTCRVGEPGTIGERVVIDLRRAHGDLEGLVTGLALDLCPVPSALPGWADVHSAILVGRGPSYDRRSVGARGRHTTDLLRGQIFRWMEAFRQTYRMVKAEFE